MTITKAKKVSKRSWSLARFSKAVKAQCAALKIKVADARLKSCYEQGVTVRDTVAILKG
jgi:hypothetical protein